MLVDLDGSTGTTISKMGERDEDGHIKQEQSLDRGVPTIDLFDPGQRGALFGDSARYIVVRSMLGCKPSDYVLSDAPEFRDKFGRTVSGRSRAMLEVVLDMPTLNPGVLARAETLKVPFAEAIHSPLLESAERIWIRRWLETWAAQLDGVRDMLGLDPDFAWNIA